MDTHREDEDPGLNRRRMRQSRRRRRLTQEALGTAIGMTQPYISDLERGIRRHLRPARLAALAAALGVPMERLVRGGQRSLEEKDEPCLTRRP